VLVPLYGFLRGDTMGIVILVQEHDTMDEVAAAMQQAASVRVTPKRVARVHFQGTVLEPGLTVARAGIQALDRVDVVQEE
jgi:toluene-4-monooxygenase system protein B